VIAGLLVWGCLALGCGPPTAEVGVTWTIEPTPPVTGAPALVRLSLVNGLGGPLRGARLRLEAHMSHPGMSPVTTSLIERSAGTYEGRVQLAMAGNWVLVVTGELPDGSRLIRQTDVAAVGPAG
jgi:hypothetical protein